MVTPELGSLTFVGSTGKYYSLSLYSSDVVGAAVTFSTYGTAAAGGQAFWNVPAEGVTLVDISIATGQTVTTAYSLNVNDVPTGNVVQLINVINTLAFRAFPKISIKGGSKFTMIQA